MTTEDPGRFRRFLGYPLVEILLGFVVFAMIFSLLFSVLSQLPVLFAGSPGLDDDLRPESSSAALALGIGQFLAALVLATVALWIYRRFFVRVCEGRTTAPELAMNTTARRWLIGGPLLAFAVVAVTVVAAGPVSWQPSLSILGGLLGALGMSIFAGVVEELFARGLLLRVSEQHIGSLLALVLTAGIFGLQHADNPGATPLSTAAVALGGGLMLASVYLLTRTLWAPIAVHFGWNFAQSVIGLPVSGNEQTGVRVAELGGPESLTGGAFGIEVSWVALVAWSVVFLTCLVLAVRAGRWQSWRNARTAVSQGQGNQPVGM